MVVELHVLDRCECCTDRGNTMPPKHYYIGLLFLASLILLVIYWCILTNEWKTVTVSVPIITIPFQKKIGNEQRPENVPTPQSMSPSRDGHSSVPTPQSMSPSRDGHSSVPTAESTSPSRDGHSSVPTAESTSPSRDGHSSVPTPQSVSPSRDGGDIHSSVPTPQSVSPSRDGGDIHSSVPTAESDSGTTHHSSVSTTVHPSNQVTSRHMTNADIHSTDVKHYTPPLRYSNTTSTTAEMVDTTQSTSQNRVIFIPKSNRKRSSVAGPDYLAADFMSTAERPITKTEQQRQQPANGANQQRPPSTANQQRPPPTANQQRPQPANGANQQRQQPANGANQQRQQPANGANQQRQQPANGANQQRQQPANGANQQRQQPTANQQQQQPTANQQRPPSTANQQRPPSTVIQQRYAPQGVRLNQLATTYRSQHQSSSSCREPYCLDYLGDKERWVYKTCLEKTRKKKPPDYDLSCPCRFMNGDGKPVVALVSLPGSGNTWVRGLLQKATGICTGSIYCDRTLRAEGFCGEGLRSSALLSIKTHDTSLQWKGVKYKNVNPNRPFFDAAIFIIRDPFRAAISEWNRQRSGQFSKSQNGSNHVKYVDTPKLFGDNPVWDNYARYHARKWRMMISSYIIKRREHSVLVVRYEDIKRATLAEVKRMLDFLKYPYSDDELRGKLEGDFTTFYRNHSYSFDHFTTSQKNYFNDIIAGVAQSVSSTIRNKLNEYIRL